MTTTIFGPACPVCGVLTALKVSELGEVLDAKQNCAPAPCDLSGEQGDALDAACEALAADWAYENPADLPDYPQCVDWADVEGDLRFHEGR